jgi:hypothetical protein
VSTECRKILQHPPHRNDYQDFSTAAEAAAGRRPPFARKQKKFFHLTLKIQGTFNLSPLYCNRSQESGAAALKLRDAFSLFSLKGTGPPIFRRPGAFICHKGFSPAEWRPEKTG